VLQKLHLSNHKLEEMVLKADKEMRAKELAKKEVTFATHRNTLQHTTTRCNTLQHIVSEG